MAEDPLDHLMSATLAIDGDAARAQRPALPFSGGADAPATAAPRAASAAFQDSGTLSESAAWPSEETSPTDHPMRSVAHPPASLPVSQLLGQPPNASPAAWVPAPQSPAPPQPRAASSAFAASNAAREPENQAVTPQASASPRARPEPTRHRVDYLWHDTLAELEMLRAASREIERKSEIEDEWLTSPGVVHATKELTQLRRLLQTGTPRSTEEVLRLYEESLDAGNDRLLCLVSGELHLSFEPIEMLRVTLSVITPFLATDAALKHAYDAAHEALKTPGGLAPSIAASHKERVDEAIRQAIRSPAASLDAVIDRALMEARAFNRRRVFGGSLVRAMLQPPGTARGKDAPNAVPSYLTDAAAEQLPLMRSIPSRMIVEVRPSQDGVELNLLAFRVLAIAREVSLSRNRH